MQHRLVLASASPARLSTLRHAGIHPEVIVSGVDESGVTADSPADLAQSLAQVKCEAVAATLDHPRTDPAMVIIGCDSVLELDGVAYGKPADAAEAKRRWQAMRGHRGVLHTGHHVIVVDDHARAVSRTASTAVEFADVSDAEIEAYVETGEPLVVAGAFTLDGLGGAFVTGIEGDPHNVVGISLPAVRLMLSELGIAWTDLWQA